MSTALKASPLKLRWSMLAVSGVLLSLSLVIFLVLMAVSWKTVAPTLFWQLEYMGVLILVTISTRTITVRKVLGFYFLGLGVCALLALVLSTPVRLVFNWPFWVDVPVPIIEETVKILPLLAFVFWPGSRWRKSAGLSDYLVAGAALGSGFTLLEDLLRGYEWQRMLDAHTGPHLGVLYLFPAADLQYGLSSSSLLHLKAAFLGHGPATAMIGLALGVAVIYGHRQGRWRWLIALPAAMWVWVVWDHVWFNLSSDGAFDGALGVIQSLVGLRGHLAGWVLLVAGLAAIVLDARAIRRHWSQAADASRLRLDELALWRCPVDRRTPLHLYLLVVARPKLRRMAAYVARNDLSPEALRGGVDRLSAGLRRPPLLSGSSTLPV